MELLNNNSSQHILNPYGDSWEFMLNTRFLSAAFAYETR